MDKLDTEYEDSEGVLTQDCTVVNGREGRVDRVGIEHKKAKEHKPETQQRRKLGITIYQSESRQIN